MGMKKGDIEGIGAGLLNEPDAAKRLLMSPRLLRQIRRRGEIRYVALSARKIAYRIDDLDAYVASKLRIDEPPMPWLPSAKGRARVRRTDDIVPLTELFPEKFKRNR